jgi:hypothetical protein
MGYVSDTSWTGTAVQPKQRSQPGQMGAFGYVSTPEDEEKTGVNPGGTGYVSGQVNPFSAPATSTGPTHVTAQPSDAGTPRGAGTGAASANVTYNPAAFTGAAPALTNAIANKQAQAGITPGVTTQSSALTSGAGTTNVSNGGVLPAQGDAAATQQKYNVNVTGNGYVDGGANAAFNPAAQTANLKSGWDYLFGAQKADLGPAIAAQNAAFGEAGNLSAERYLYRPGAAPSQERVALDAAEQEQIRQRQLASLAALEGAANGTIPSAAEIQLRQQAARNAAANLGAARALGGRSAGGAAHAATVANAESGLETNVAGAQLRAAEQERARAALVGALQGVRGQDVDVAQANANLAQAANANNLTAQERQNQLAEEHRKTLLMAQLQAMGIGADAAAAIVNGSKANADAENKVKGGFTQGISTMAAIL